MFGKSFEEKVNEAVAQLGSMGVKGAMAKIEGKTVTLMGTAHDPAAKAKAMAWFNEQVDTENTMNMIKVEVPKPAAPAPAPPAAVAPAPAAAAPAAPPVAAAARPTETQRLHMVEKGETLSGIAQKYYGKASAYMKIFEANKDTLKDPDKIFPGQKLRIP